MLAIPPPIVHGGSQWRTAMFLAELNWAADCAAPVFSLIAAGVALPVRAVALSSR
jgi:hypothetical protein